METFIKTLIYIHAFFGGIGLIAGFCNYYCKKRFIQSQTLWKGIFRRNACQLFTISYRCSNASSQNLFLFLIGIFTIYMILAGNAALSFKSRSKESASVKDYAISYIMLLSGILMVIMAVINWSVKPTVFYTISYLRRPWHPNEQQRYFIL